MPFTNARFNNFNVSTGEETSIVTSIGDYLVTWDFLKVKRGVLDSYQIKQVKSNPVDNQFKFNDAEKILVTDPFAVGMHTRKKKVRFEV